MRAVALFAALCAAGCASRWVDVSPLPPTHYEKLGPAEGQACAVSYLPLPWHQIVSRGAGDRLERARERALASVPGATGLVNVTLQESWAYYVLGSSRCVTLRGDAIR